MKKKWIIRGISILGIIYISTLVVLFFIQESLIFFPEKLDKNFKYQFENQFEEIQIKTNDEKNLSGLLFKVPNPKGLIFFLHGNSGSLKEIGKESLVYNALNYDVFVYDYRGYGKSEGKIENQEDLFSDSQIAYDKMKQMYNENQITIVGYSLGTGLASQLASTNHPNKLILQAPYYSMEDLMKRKSSLLPSFILKYKLQSNKYLQKVQTPIYIFHGKDDEVIYFWSSLKLKSELKNKVVLFPLENQGHENIINNTKFQAELKNILDTE